MDDEDKTKEQLIEELAELRNRIVELEKSEKEWKRTEKALRESEENLRDFFDNAAELVQQVGPDGKILHVNNAWCKTLGYTKEEALKLNLQNIIHPDHLPQCMDLFKRVAQGETVQNVETIFISKDGREVVIEGNANGRFKNREFISTRGIFHDVTERKKMEEAVANANKQLEAQVYQQREITRALIDDVGVERASGILYECGWKVAMKEAKDVRNNWEGGVKEFVKRYIAPISNSTGMAVELTDWDEVNKKAGIILKHSGDSVDKKTHKAVEASYTSGFLAGLLSLAFGVPVAVENIKSAAKGDGCWEFVTRELEHYERDVYTLA